MIAQHLIPYVPQLHAFMENVGSKLPSEDLTEVSTGIAYVISAMNSEQAVQALPLFCKPILDQVKTFAASQGQASKSDLNSLDGAFGRFLVAVLSQSDARRCPTAPSEVPRGLHE